MAGDALGGSTDCSDNKDAIARQRTHSLLGKVIQLSLGGALDCSAEGGWVKVLTVLVSEAGNHALGSGI